MSVPASRAVPRGRDALGEIPAKADAPGSMARRTQTLEAKTSATAERPRENRKAETHERILRVAAELFIERGFKATSVSAIAARGGVSRSAVFWHFGSKPALFQEICKEMLIPFRRALQLSFQHLDARKRLSELFCVYQDFVQTNRATIEAFVRWSLEDPALQSSLRAELMSLHQVFLRDVESTLAELLAHPEEAPVFASGLVSLLDGHLVLQMFDGGSGVGERRRLGLEAITQCILEHRGSG
jgi:AcrR family transcriptional regulator